MKVIGGEEPGVKFCGKLYAALDFTAPTSLHEGTQSEYIQIPLGWQLASEIPNLVKDVIGRFPWGTHVMVLADGRGFRTSGGGAGEQFIRDLSNPSASELVNTQAGWRPKSSKMRILIFREGVRPNNHSMEMAAKLWENKSFHDCEVVCGETVFPCHRAVLAHSSPVMERMFGSEMAEAQSRRIVVGDSSPSCVNGLLEFMYTGIVTVCDKSDLGLLRLADLYQLDALLLDCVGVAIETLSINNVAEVARALRPFKDRSNVSALWKELVAKVRDLDDLAESVLLQV